jgi:hypothetical protein
MEIVKLVVVFKPTDRLTVEGVRTAVAGGSELAHSRDLLTYSCWSYASVPMAITANSRAKLTQMAA